MAQFICFWAIFQCCKWPNIENTILSSGHTASKHITSKNYDFNIFSSSTTYIQIISYKLHSISMITNTLHYEWFNTFCYIKYESIGICDFQYNTNHTILTQISNTRNPLNLHTFFLRLWNVYEPTLQSYRSAHSSIHCEVHALWRSKWMCFRVPIFIPVCFSNQESGLSILKFSLSVCPLWPDSANFPFWQHVKSIWRLFESLFSSWQNFIIKW